MDDEEEEECVSQKVLTRNVLAQTLEHLAKLSVGHGAGLVGIKLVSREKVSTEDTALFLSSLFSSQQTNLIEDAAKLLYLVFTEDDLLPFGSHLVFSELEG